MEPDIMPHSGEYIHWDNPINRLYCNLPYNCMRISDACLMEEITVFLDKVRLSEYKERFLEEITDVKEFRTFLSDQECLRQRIGLSNLEVNRFVRLCESTINEMGVLTISRTVPPPPQATKAKTTTVTNKISTVPTTKPQSIPKTKETTNTKNSNAQVRNILQLSLKFLSIEGIVRDRRYQICVPKSIPYYRLVDTVYREVKRGLPEVKFNSVELFSRTGYPIANSPSVFVCPLSSWYLEDNELIYVYPKVIKYEYMFESDIDAVESVVNISLKDSKSVYTFTFYTDKISVCDLKVKISLNIHIPSDTITIWKYNKHKREEEQTLNNEEIPLKLINQSQLSFSVSDSYDDCDFLASFKSNLYTSHIPTPLPCFHVFNGQLLYLVREHLSKRDNNRLKMKLGLIRTISCSPPLVYSLFLLFSDCKVSLPHRVAINEGIITTISLLTNRTSLTHFPELWMYVEEFADSHHALTEEYETTFISKRTRDCPKDDESRRLIAVFPPSQETIVTWRDCPSSHEPFSHLLSIPLKEFTPGVETRFPTLHPMELYRKFIEERTNYGLMLPLFQGLSSPCVFLDRTRGRYGYFDYFSPEDGQIHSYNPHDISISSRLEISNTMSYQKIILILDLSSDMYLAFGEYLTSSHSNVPNLVPKQPDAALLIIEMLINRIVGLECKYLLGAIVISNNTNFPYGMLELQKPTFEYVHVLEQLKTSVYRYIPSFGLRKYPQGIILSVLDYCMSQYFDPRKSLQTKIFLFTNASYKYYGSRKDSFERKFRESCCVLNSIILSQEFAHSIETLVRLTNGKHINYRSICKYISNTTAPIATTPHLCLEYGSYLEDYLHIDNPETQSATYNELSRKLSEKLLTTEDFLETTHKHKQQYEDMINNGVMYPIQILGRISAYIKTPNPYCKLFPYNSDILKWLLFIQGPPHTPFADSVLILEMIFGENFPLFSPKLRFLSLVYHPNVSYSGHVCLPILSEDWNVNVSLKQVFDSLLMMLTDPIRSHFVRSKVAEIYYSSRQLYNSLVTSWLDIKLLRERNLANIEQDFKIVSNTSSPVHPAALTCPLTNQLFDTPVITPCGNTYELSAVLEVIQNEGVDPISKSPLLEGDLIPNRGITDAVLKHRRKVFSRSYWWDA